MERFDILKFLSENPMKTVDLCMLFILKNNMNWKETVYREAIKEIKSIERKIIDMHEELIKDMKIVNPMGILQFDEGNMDAEVLTKSFTVVAEKIRDNEHPKAEDLSTLASIESMLRFNRNLMPRQSLKMKEYRWQKDACQAQLLSLKNPHLSATQEFVATF